VGPKSKVAGGCNEPAEERPLRADAARNRARILEAAEVVFAAEGIEAPVDDIAEKAGVGVGSLYRHFPTKEKLCEAILIDRLRDLTNDARAQADAVDPVAAFFGFLEHFVELGAAKRDLIVAVTGAGLDFDEAAAPVKEDLREAVGVLLRRAQDAEAVREDVTPAAIIGLISATCHAAGYNHEAPVMDLLGIVCDGLRPPNSP
jgi:AcrR family transcriptional regulator